MLSRFVDASGAVVRCPATPGFGWLAGHHWTWNPARLDELISAAGPSTIFVRGNAANETDLADRFTHVLLLEIDEPTMLAPPPQDQARYARDGDPAVEREAGGPGPDDDRPVPGAVSPPPVPAPARR